MSMQEKVMSIQEQYSELKKYRKPQPLDVINDKKRKAWEYFRNLVLVNNLEQNLSKSFSLYYAPVRQIHRSNMACWQSQDGLSKEIYIDETFALNNPLITKIQTTHEVLHGLSQMKNGNQFFFGHRYKGNGQSVYSGIDEATTQLFAEDIEKQRLSEKEDYLYFVKNIMRVMKVIFGSDKLANQYLNNNNQFEQDFNKLTGGKFDAFVSMINEVYLLSKTKRYETLSAEDMKLLEDRKEQILNFTKGLIRNISQNNQELLQQLSLELDKDFFSKLSIKSNEIEYVYYLHGTADQSPETLEDIFNNGLILERDVELHLHSTLAPISEEDIQALGLENIMNSYSQSEDFNSVFLIKIPKEYLSCKSHRDGSIDMPMPLWKNIGNGNSVLTPHLIQGVYNKHINKGITNPNYCPLYNPNGMAYSWEQFNVFASYNRTDLMNEYKQRQFTSFQQQYAIDNTRKTFEQTIKYYQNKFGKLPQPQLFDSSEYKILLDQYLNQNNNFKR